MHRLSLLAAAIVFGLGSLAQAAEPPHLCPLSGHDEAEQVGVAAESGRPSPLTSASRPAAPIGRPG